MHKLSITRDNNVAIAQVLQLMPHSSMENIVTYACACNSGTFCYQPAMNF